MIINLIIILLLIHTSYADPRAQIIKLICGTHPQNDSDVVIPNFFSSMEDVSRQLRTSGFGLAETGRGADASYGFVQCYRDIPLTECTLCYAEARTNLPQCHPAVQGRIYLDGCYLRYDNYSFFHEYRGLNDQVVCGVQTPRADSIFQESAKKAILEAAVAASRNRGFGWAHVGPGEGNGNSAYVLAECWRTLEPWACQACLQNASVSILGCLPAAEGRALNTGCFMRYSDTNFLNPMPGNGNIRGRVVAVLAAAVTATAALVIGAVAGFYTWKKRTIQKKRKGRRLHN